MIADEDDDQKANKLRKKHKIKKKKYPWMGCTFNKVWGRGGNKLVQIKHDCLDICLDKCIHNPEAFVWRMFTSSGVTTLYGNNFTYIKLHVFVFVAWINDKDMKLYITLI